MQLSAHVLPAAVEASAAGAEYLFNVIVPGFGDGKGSAFGSRFNQRHFQIYLKGYGLFPYPSQASYSHNDYR
jgi:hypothetical protein